MAETALILPPTAQNPRNSEGDFIQLDDGRLYFVYTHYRDGGGGDHGAAFLAARVSTDRGCTWSAQDELILENAEAGMNIMSVTLRRLNDGAIALFYLRKDAADHCTPMVRFSRDEMDSWSGPIPCVPDQKGYFVLNNDRVIQTRTGRILLAVARHSQLGGQWHNGGDIFVYASDDNGESWFCAASVPNPDQVVLQEPGLIELNDGSLLLFMRSDIGYQCFSYSVDDGESWSAPRAGNLVSPCSPASMKRIPNTGDILALWNHNRHQHPPRARTPLTAAISTDEGATWQFHRDFYDDPEGWYCYTAIHFIDDYVLLGHCAGKRGVGQLATTRITRVSIGELYRK